MRSVGDAAYGREVLRQRGLNRLSPSANLAFKDDLSPETLAAHRNWLLRKRPSRPRDLQSVCVASEQRVSCRNSMSTSTLPAINLLHYYKVLCTGEHQASTSSNLRRNALPFTTSSSCSSSFFGSRLISDVRNSPMHRTASASLC
jgi:hypothetical protein